MTVEYIRPFKPDKMIQRMDTGKCLYRCCFCAAHYSYYIGESQSVTSVTAKSMSSLLHQSDNPGLITVVYSYRFALVWVPRYSYPFLCVFQQSKTSGVISNYHPKENWLQIIYRFPANGNRLVPVPVLLIAPVIQRNVRLSQTVRSATAESLSRLLHQSNYTGLITVVYSYKFAFGLSSQVIVTFLCVFANKVRHQKLTLIPFLRELASNKTKSSSEWIQVSASTDAIPVLNTAPIIHEVSVSVMR